MENREVKTEIPFGANDSELCECEYTIPEGYKAEIKDGKVIVRKVESEDEKIVKSLKKCFEWLRDEARWTDVYGSSFESIFAYIEKKGKQKLADIKPIFVVGDVMRTKEEAKKGWKDGMPVIISIDEEYYHCTNELIAIKDQDVYEYPPMNREQKTAEWSEEDKKNLEQAIYVCHQYGYTGVENWLKSHRQKLSNVDSS